MEKERYPLICDDLHLHRLGIVRCPIPTKLKEERMYWAQSLSQITPLNHTSEDGEYAFYRNIMDEPNFPFECILNSEIGEKIKEHFLGITSQRNHSNDCDSGSNTDDESSNLDKILRLDDAFCIQYNTTQDDTTCAKHMDPSDITVNICMEKSEDCTGSQVVFYGKQPLKSCSLHEIDLETTDTDGSANTINSEEFIFMVDQLEGYATIHWGHHPHMTLPLGNGRRTNIVLTFCFRDESKSDVRLRTCYAIT